MGDALGGPSEPEVSDVHLPLLDRAVLVVGGLVLGLVLAWGLPWLSGLAGSLEWFPFRDVLRLIGRLSTEHPVVSIMLWVALPLAGMIGGVLLGAAATTIRVADGEIIISKDDDRTRVARAQVDRILLEGKQLSIRDDRDVDLVTTKLDVPVDEVVTALEVHGWTVERK